MQTVRYIYSLSCLSLSLSLSFSLCVSLLIPLSLFFSFILCQKPSTRFHAYNTFFATILFSLLAKENWVNPELAVIQISVIFLLSYKRINFVLVDFFLQYPGQKVIKFLFLVQKFFLFFLSLNHIRFGGKMNPL